MKLAYILANYPCRSELFAAREIAQMRKQGCQLSVLAASADQPADAADALEPTTYGLPLWSRAGAEAVGYLFFRYPLAGFRLIRLSLQLLLSCPRELVTLLGNIHTIGCFAKYLDTEEISHVHAYFLSWPAVMGLGLARLTGRSLSIAAHARDIFIESGAHAIKANEACFIAVCSKQGLEHLKQKLPKKQHQKLLLMHHGVDLKHLAHAHIGAKEEAEGYDVVGVGRLVPKKGHAYLLMAFALIREVFPETHLCIVGDGPERDYLQDFSRSLGIDQSVTFVGWQDPDTTCEIIRRSTVLAVPSIVAADGDRDGIPNVILEAYALGTAVVATTAGAIPEVVEDRKTGMLVPPANVEDLAQATGVLLEDNDLRNSLCKAAYEVAKSCFDIEKNTRKLAKLLEAYANE